MTEETKMPAPAKERGVRLPTIFVPHGGGPWPFVKVPGMDGKMESLREYLVNLPELLPAKPKTLLVISAHWEEKVPTVQSQAAPPMLYDYSGFPPESYEITWPAPGNPALAAEVRELLEGRGIASAASAWLLKKVFLVDVTECPDCGGRMKWLEVCTEQRDINRVLAASGLAPRAPPSVGWTPLGQMRFSF